MHEIGVRDLKASLSEVLRRVRDGQQVRVTLRGEPVADIVPAGAHRADDRLTALVTDGRVSPPSQSLPGTPPPLARGSRSATALVLDERDNEP
jgi:prevent-host-death family protein